MIKVGDRVKGFEFADQEHIQMSAFMHKLIDVVGTIVEIDNKSDSFIIGFGDESAIWRYPIGQYLAILREEKLNELGI